MYFLFMIIFLCMGQSYGMQNEVDVIDQDYRVLVPYIVRMLEVTKEEFTPFQLLTSLTQPSAYINIAVRCNYLTPSAHIEQIMQRHKIRMARDWAKQKSSFGQNKDSYHSWFISYFQNEIVPRMVRDLKKERAEQKVLESNSSSGI